MKTDLNYFSFIKIPNKKAHCIQILKMCDKLQESFNVYLFCLKGVRENIKKNFSLKKNLKIKHLLYSNYRIINFLLKLFYVIKFKKKNSIVFTRDVHFAFWSLFFYKKVFLELHIHFLKRKSLSYYLLKLLFKSEKIRKVFISNELYRFYKKDYHKINNFVIAHDASDNHFDNSKQKKNKTKLSVGYCGHLYPGRGIELIINLAKLDKKTEFNILGGFKVDANRIKKKSIFPKNLNFLKHTNYKDVSNFLSKNDILIAPYQKKLSTNVNTDTSKYMSPLKIFEYMSAKKAIISSNHKVLQEVLENNKNAILCNSERLQEWVMAIKRLKNKKLRNKLSCNAYNKFVKKYTWEKRVSAIFNE